MHPHAELVDRLFRHLAALNPGEMAKCYHEKATFKDIAFQRNGRQEILEMWMFVTRPEPGLKVSFEIVSADDSAARATVIDDYTYTETGRAVHNVIDSRFRFKDGLIIEHHDFCDPVRWANMAMTGPKAWLAGHFEFVRASAAKKKLDAFLRNGGK